MGASEDERGTALAEIRQKAAPRSTAGSHTNATRGWPEPSSSFQEEAIGEEPVNHVKRVQMVLVVGCWQMSTQD